ncbi:MAG TPA: C-GCAxxG-C-C family (seleno)protein [Anaerolineaceae bacterium]|nr:C-GCAxxG-C-C family (seleno)protein [Anaerolineaceae bacterium]
MSDESTPTPASKIESRRQFLKSAGVFAAAAAIAGCAQTPPPTPETIIQTVEVPTEVEVVKEVEVEKPLPAHPWTYVELDPKQARILGHQNYFNVNCCYGAFVAIVDALKEKVGYPFDQFPSLMFAFGGGGMAGWGGTCGALIGAAAAINLLLPPKEASPIISELVGWYTTTALPTKEANDLAANGEYVAEMVFAGELPQSEAHSMLCHASVTNWCQAAQLGSGSPEVKERCGRLTGDVAAKAVEMLNAKLAGSFAPAFAQDETTATCLGCHAPGESFEAGQFTRGLQECTSCHEPHD